MGRWFPGFRTGTPEQVREYREAQRAQFRNSGYLSKTYPRGQYPENHPWYQRFNTRTHETAQPLSRTQRAWHFQRALTEHDREATRLQRASDRQDREQRRAGRSR
jgi:hypothetical protein